MIRENGFLCLTVSDKGDSMAGERRRYRSEHVNPKFIKFHCDGQVFSQTAVYLEPYKGTTASSEKHNETPEEIRSVLRQMERQGIGTNIHVVGDGAARTALDAIADVRKGAGYDGPRHLLAHSYFIGDVDAARIAPLNIVAEFTWATMDPDKAETM